MEFAVQYAPAGHTSALYAEGQYDPAGHAAHASARVVKDPASATSSRLEAASHASCEGELKPARVEGPSENGLPCAPASVTTTAVSAKIFRRRPVLESATNTLPAASEAMPQGPEKLAEAPTPSIEKELPLPASVLSVPLGHATRTRLLPESVTYSGPPPPPKRPSKAMLRRETSVPTPGGPSANVGAAVEHVPAYVVYAPPARASGENTWMQ
jgi:hypothetical protein